MRTPPKDAARRPEGRRGDRSERVVPFGSRGRGPLTVALVASAGIHVFLAAVVAFPHPEPAPHGGEGPIRHVELPPRVRVPPPPHAVGRPPAPEAREVDVDEPVGTAATPVPAPPSGPTPRPPEVSAASPFEWSSVARADVPPLMEAPDQLRERLRRRYPDRLQELRRGGVVELRFFIDARGEVDAVEVVESSGHRRLDDAAARITEEASFLPAMVRDRPVGVRVSQRICFVFVEAAEERPTPEECEQRVALEGS